MDLGALGVLTAPTVVDVHGPLEVAHLVLTAAYLGFQVTIRVLVYPQFAAVAAADFPTYERRHQRLVSLVVGPLFAGLAVTSCGVLVLDGPVGVASAAVYAALLGATALGAVPQHRVLDAGFEPRAHRRLLAWDSVRVLLAAVNVALAVALL